MKKLCFVLWLGLSFSWLGFGGKSDSKTGSTEEPWTLNMPEVIEDKNGDPIGLKLHLPASLVKACGDKFWELCDSKIKECIEAYMSTSEGCIKWCEENLSGTNYQHEKRCEFAYALYLANEKNYILSGTFCKQAKLNEVLTCLNMRGAICCACLQQTEAEQYINSMYWIISDF